MGKGFPFAYFDQKQTHESWGYFSEVLEVASHHTGRHIFVQKNLMKWPAPGDSSRDLFIFFLEVTFTAFKKTGHVNSPSQKGHQQNCQAGFFHLPVLNSVFLLRKFDQKHANLKQISEETHQFSTIDQYILSNSWIFSKSRMVYLPFIYHKYQLFMYRQIDLFAWMGPCDPGPWFCETTLDETTQGSTVFELVSEAVPNTLLAVCSSKAAHLVMSKRSNGSGDFFWSEKNCLAILLVTFLGWWKRDPLKG